MPPGVRTDPYLDFRFYVEIEGIVVAGFSEVSGLDIEVRTEEYREGGRNDYTHELPGQAVHSNVELRTGLTDSHALIDWIRAVADGRVERKNVFIYLIDSTGAPARGWQCQEAYPVRYAGPELQAQQGGVAVETVELTHRGLSPMGLSG